MPIPQKPNNIVECLHLKMIKQTLFFVLLLLQLSACDNKLQAAQTAEEDGLKNYDHVYLDNIKSVRFHLDNVFLSYPIIDLYSNSQLVLSFDDMNEDVMDYTYSIVHCDKDWKKSDLDEIDFLEGFNGEPVDNYDFSFNTLTEYTHYKIRLPNEDIRWLVSGNFLLHVFEDDENRRPIITRRFMVTESIMRVTPNIVPPSRTNKYRTHQEIDFVVNYKGQDIRNPRKEVSACILQNGRWDNAVTDVMPMFTRQEELSFDYQDKIIFPAGKEFRFMDIRSFRYPRQGIADVKRDNRYWDVVAKLDQSRAFQTYEFYNDINGKFVIEHMEENRPDLEGDYAKVLFPLKASQALEGKSVYIVGGLTDWQLKEEFKMIYNPAIGGYVAQPLLKQGFYNYYFVTVDEGGNEYDYEEFEGNWHLTENDYTILIYYRPFGQRYDRLVATRTFNSSNN